MNKILFLIAFSMILSFGMIHNTYSRENNRYEEFASGKNEEVEKPLLNNNLPVEYEATEQEEAEHGKDEKNDHEDNMSSLFFIIIALIIGAATRHFLRKSPIPFTVSLLILGIGFGAATRLGFFDSWSIGSLKINLEFISSSIEWAGTIDPHLILFVFLPTLIFEAAFAMDVHTFRKSLTNAILLAVPGIIIALLLTGALAIAMGTLGIGLAKWGWPVALMFGAVISATDPIAVVSLLKGLGASKKLRTLIEGESLLNDGTAIVIFMVFFLSITGAVTVSSPVIEFVRVALGGILIGIIIGAVTIAWVRRVFNDALVEISVVIAAAYLTFFVAEHFMHVSGVLGLVAFGLAMASVGRTRISPEVEHFLHEFWELAAFIANTLIFFIVGVVIAQRTFFTANDFLILAIVYIGIHIVRAIVIFILYPIMRKAGYGLAVKDAYVLWYGALRGAIGLALALIVAGEETIDADIRAQFLFLTAGIVTLTLLINATTIKFLIEALGLTKIAPAKALMILNANKYLRQSAENALDKIKEDRFMSRANWNTVRDYLPQTADINQEESGQIETIAETRRRILEKEKSSYWHQFKDGLLGPGPVRRLSDGINDILDAGGLISLAKRKDLEELWKTPKLLNKVQSLPILGKPARRFFFEKLTTSYDCARGFVEAQEEALKLVESMYRSLDDTKKADREEAKNLSIIENEINENRIHGLTFLRNLNKEYPEIYSAIATRQAARSMLNYERRTVERLLKNGRLENDEASKMIINIEERMKKLMDTPPLIKLPDTVELLREVPWLSDLDSKTFSQVVDLFQNRIYAVGDKLIKKSEAGGELFFIARGTVKVTIGKQVVDILGQGNIIGEMAGLTGLSRTATIEAESPVSVLWMSSSNMQKLMRNSKVLEERLWKIAAERFAENLLGKIKPYSQWRQTRLRNMISKGEFITYEQGKVFELKDKVGVVISGKVFKSDQGKKAISAPAFLEASKYILSKNAHILIF